MSNVRERITGIPIGARVAVAVVVALVLLNLGARALDESVGGGEPTGRPASSFATRADGLAAYADLLNRWGHRTARQRGDLVDAELDPSTTLMVLDPPFLSENDAGAALQFAVNGGRLVIGGDEPGRYLHALRDDPPTWERGGPSRFAGSAAPFDGLRRVTTGGDGAFEDPGSSTSLVDAGGRALLTREAVGRGEVLFLADVAPLTNERLARADNAAFAVLLAGTEGRDVVFAEGVHGYGARRGLGAVPTKWKFALAGVGLAALVLMWARGRRLGPPEESERALPPPRRAYVDALAVTLERTRERADAVKPVRDAVRSRVANRAGLSPDASPADVDRAGAALGFDEDERRVLARGPNDDDDVLAIGRALARAERWDGGRDE